MIDDAYDFDNRLQKIMKNAIWIFLQMFHLVFEFLRQKCSNNFSFEK